MFIYSLLICDKVIRIESERGKFIRFCKGYIIQEPAPEPDIIISVSESEIKAQRNMSDLYGSDMLEGFVILRKLAKYLLENESTIFMHGSVVAYNNSAYMFTAESGVGKTTHSRLWISNLKDAFILNGDKPFISIKDDSIIAWGSPWCGSERYNRNEGVPLKAICILKRADKNSITEISYQDVLPELANQTGIPDIKNVNMRLLVTELLCGLVKKIKIYRYDMNNFEDNAFLTTFQVLSKLD